MHLVNFQNLGLCYHFVTFSFTTVDNRPILVSIVNFFLTRCIEYKAV